MNNLRFIRPAFRLIREQVVRIVLYQSLITLHRKGPPAQINLIPPFQKQGRLIVSHHVYPIQTVRTEPICDKEQSACHHNSYNGRIAHPHRQIPTFLFIYGMVGHLFPSPVCIKLFGFTRSRRFLIHTTHPLIFLSVFLRLTQPLVNNLLFLIGSLMS